MRRACVGPLKKSGSPNEMCCAPAATCARTSSSTTSTGIARNAPRYTGTIGQWRHRCLQPRVASVAPTTRRRAVGHLQRRIALQRQQRRAIGLNELQLRDHRAWELGVWELGVGRDVGISQRHQVLLSLRPEHVRHAAFAQPGGIERRIEPVRDDRRAWIDEPNAIDDAEPPGAWRYAWADRTRRSAAC